MFTSIRFRILIASVAIVSGALMINTVLNYSVANQYNRDAINQSLAAVLTGHETGIEEWVASKSKMISSLRDVALSNDPVPAFRQIAIAGGFTTVYAGYADKTARFSDSTGIPSGYDPTVRPWYRQAAEAGHAIVTPPYVDTATGNLVVTFAVPILRDGALRGVVSGDVSMDAVVTNVKTIHPTPASFGMVVDRDGHIVAYADQKLTLKPFSELAPDLMMSELTASAANDESAPLVAHIAGNAKLIRARVVPGTDWLAVVALDQSEATAGIRSLLHVSFVSLTVLVVIAAAIIGAVTSVTFRGLARVRDAMEAIASGDGDLTERLPESGRDEVAQIARSYNSFIGKISDVIRRIKDTSESVRHAASEIASGNHDLSRRTEMAAANLQQTAASMEEITSTVAQAANAALQANQTVSTARTSAMRGSSVVANVVSTMSEIEGASGKISEIIGVVDSIAFQTNILALNAAVEAARAGDGGRGFAVVAGEVRTLAQRSAQAAKEIKALIDSNVASVSSGSTYVNEAGQTMNDIVAGISNVTTIMSEISNAADEQNRGIHEINRAVSQLDEMVQQNAALVEESAAAASALQTQATELADAVAQFTVS
ncbi:HAMP domain-containing protein [Paraburkholderia sp. Tr-20389]|uniref:methyl-accepting chemotaxis protein n=1 Tax=Paraburkholderia sp. Tr-20389 TaxID=2703903 RepID=UPI00197F780B|nr:methyl-accepting chemotaxis protein [Paraburkholderia sp. Tr-20389]MBN3754375.1 HAMP domain-containing protein [Paraburkholderia sp. Tr-20389]